MFLFLNIFRISPGLPNVIDELPYGFSVIDEAASGSNINLYNKSQMTGAFFCYYYS